MCIDLRAVVRIAVHRAVCLAGIPNCDMAFRTITTTFPDALRAHTSQYTGYFRIEAMKSYRSLGAFGIDEIHIA